MNKRKLSAVLIAVVLILSLLGFAGCDSRSDSEQTTENEAVFSQPAEDEITESYSEKDDSEAASENNKAESSGLKLSEVPDFSGKAYVALNNNVPGFSASEMSTNSFEVYESLDYLGRCGIAFACLGRDIMPTEERGSIGQVKPSGWQTVRYDFVDGKYLYNRCHLIGFQLSGENANTRNLITGTRYMNVEGMLPFENMVADYIKETDNHVMYRVTPIFDGSELVARGVQLEAYSVEDDGDGICFNVYCYNNQPGVEINYRTGESRLSEVTYTEETRNNSEAVKTDYVLNVSSKKFHYPTCRSVKNMSDENRSEYRGTRDELINRGYSSCGICHP